MSKLRIGFLTLAVVAAAARPVRADEPPRHFACKFDKGYSWTYEAGKFKSAPPADLSFEIASIDLDKQTASLIIGGKTSNTLKAVRALNANTFMKSPTKASCTSRPSMIAIPRPAPTRPCIRAISGFLASLCSRNMRVTARQSPIPER